METTLREIDLHFSAIQRKLSEIKDSDDVDESIKAKLDDAIIHCIQLNHSIDSALCPDAYS